MLRERIRQRRQRARYAHCEDGDTDGDERGEGEGDSAFTKQMTEILLDENSRMMRRIRTLESIASSQTVSIRKLREDVKDLTGTLHEFTDVIALLRQAGLSMEGQNERSDRQKEMKDTSKGSPKKKSESQKSPSSESSDASSSGSAGFRYEYEYFDAPDIFGEAPASVIDAADSAGSSILAAMLGGHRRMLVDVRDADLSSDPSLLAQFIELSILPVAAGLEGLTAASRNRVKIVFSSVSCLLDYRREMALSAPDVVTLSTLDFAVAEEGDAIVVFVAPAPDDMEATEKLQKLLEPSDPKDKLQPIVVLLNHHMIPIEVNGADLSVYEPVYHLRLLSVQYISGAGGNDVSTNMTATATTTPTTPEEEQEDIADEELGEEAMMKTEEDEDEALEAAMAHANTGTMTHEGVTRAMVIRAYPRPWHIFVDTSPDLLDVDFEVAVTFDREPNMTEINARPWHIFVDTSPDLLDVDFEVAVTFDREPNMTEINASIVECIEGSEMEDEIVAQQMQTAFESGQLSGVMNEWMIATGKVEEEDSEEEDENDIQDEEEKDQG
eukprot:CAMPEP_0113326502 /NCGR_PEP_ID=MMETSP0010_2-20120614/18562_1 /TAXON_ID=216773 ORGANISM="Corethron hystrix, Strain 308" /NCGR_SAMPLE_ID=MMETSP0010_2 /ASSEMBLY_ACC=CAM_ASM_000155 /LENGTH=553 /DNA_ID=CAMNT_0000186851 /DNA_START=405 /DNA_END=2066 /DNA_ORIENTATION=+ /assembly_acc=CAM_ASM_000155